MSNEQMWIGDTEAFNELISPGYNIKREIAGDYVVTARAIAKLNNIADPVCYISASTPGYLSKPISRKEAELAAKSNPMQYFSIQ